MLVVIILNHQCNGKFHTDFESIHTVIIDASTWVDIDLMGIQTLFELRDECNKHTPNKIQLLIACAKGKIIRDRLKECQYIETVKMQSSFFMSNDDAILRRRRPCLSIASMNMYYQQATNTENPLLSPTSNSARNRRDSRLKKVISSASYAESI